LLTLCQEFWILLEIKGREVDVSIRQYIEQVSKIATNIGEVRPTEVNSLFQWYRDATCYYRPNISAGLRFDLRLPDQLQRQLTQSRLDQFPELANERGAVTYPLWGAATDGKPGTRTVITSVGIQTCYGWWVPTPYVKQFEEQLRRRHQGKAWTVAEEAKKRLRAISKGETRRRIIRVIARLKRIALRLRVEYPDPRDKIDKRLDTFLARASEKLGSPVWIQRVASGYAPAPVPEIWNDPLAVDWFEESFYEYLEYVGTRPGAKFWVWKVLQNECGFSSSNGWRSIRRHVRQRVEKGWKRDAWAIASRQSSTG